MHVLEASVAGLATVDVSVCGAAPLNNSLVVRTRSAFQIEVHPPNLVSYLRGSLWKMENDIAVGIPVRLEVLADPTARAERARLDPDITFAQPLGGLVVGSEVVTSARLSDVIFDETDQRPSAG